MAPGHKQGDFPGWCTSDIKKNLQSVFLSTDLNNNGFCICQVCLPSVSVMGGRSSSNIPSINRIEFGNPSIVLRRVSILMACNSLMIVIFSLFFCDVKYWRILSSLVIASSLSLSLSIPNQRMGMCNTCVKLSAATWKS